MYVLLYVYAHLCGQEVVVAGLRSVAGKNGNYAVALTTAGHSAGFGFPDTLQPETASHHHSIHSSVPALHHFTISQLIVISVSTTLIPIHPWYAFRCLSPSLFHSSHIQQHTNTPSMPSGIYIKCFLTKCCSTLLFKH